MEVYHLVLCCLLFTTAVCSSKLDAFQEHASGSQLVYINDQNCKCENGDCFADKQGNTKCICKPGFALQDEMTCKPCDCGPLGKCIFILTLASSVPSDEYRYEKKCVCDVGKAEKDGVCVDCFCGSNSACDFDHGEQRCYCIEGYSEKDGVCTKCDCGLNGKCEYENGNKKCDCDDGYLEINGICEECNCGDHGTCSFVNGQRTCKCEPGFSVKDGKCEQCYCGDYASSCNFNGNQKKCICLEGYVQKGEMCKLGCSAKNPCQNGGYCKDGFCFCLNGTRGDFCDVIDECPYLCPKQVDVNCAYDTASQKAFCKCLDNNLNYDPNVKQCRSDCDKSNDCLNGGKCGFNGAKKFCNCLPGTQGDRCEIVDDCVSGSNKCYGDSAYCAFDVNTQKAICKCKISDEEYDHDIRRCRFFCKEYGDCLNGGECFIKTGFCSCLPKTHGTRCEIVDDCHYGRVRCRGSNAYCTYDTEKQNGICECKSTKEYYSSFCRKCMSKLLLVLRKGICAIFDLLGLKSYVNNMDR